MTEKSWRSAESPRGAAQFVILSEVEGPLRRREPSCLPQQPSVVIALSRNGRHVDAR
jgi:hypothetical protein